MHALPHWPNTCTIKYTFTSRNRWWQWYNFATSELLELVARLHIDDLQSVCKVWDKCESIIICLVNSKCMLIAVVSCFICLTLSFDISCLAFSNACICFYVILRHLRFNGQSFTDLLCVLLVKCKAVGLISCFSN